MEYFSNYILPILKALMGSGIIGTIVYLWIKHKHEKNIEHNKCEYNKEFEILHDKIHFSQKIRGKYLDITQAALTSMAYSRSSCRYIVAILGCYYLPQKHVKFEKYLKPGDDQLTISDIHKKVEIEIDNIVRKRSELRGLIYRNSVYLPKKVYNVLHDTSILYNYLPGYFWKLQLSTSDDARNNNIQVLNSIEQIYKKIDSIYSKLKNDINDFVDETTDIHKLL